MFFIGVDIGTNSTRAMLTDARGRGMAIASRAYPLNCPAPGVAEQNPEDWYQAVAECVREVASNCAGPIGGISFSTQGGSTAPFDEAGRAIRPAMSWMDCRATNETRDMLEIRDARAWYDETGVEPSPHYSLGHISWLKAHERDVFRAARWFFTTSDFINYRLTGHAVIDRTNALMTGMLNQATGDWDELALSESGVTRERLPEILDSGALVGCLTRQAAADLGVAENVPVYNGAHDQYACALGAGAINDGDSMLSCGTAWVLLGAFRDRMRDSARALTPGFHAVPGMRGAFYALSAGSQVLNWTLSQTELSGKFGDVNSESARRIQKNRDLFFFPYLAGAVSLDPGAMPRGVMSGLTLATDKYDLALAAMEGVAFETVRAVRHFAETGVSIKRLRMFGGAAKSDLWAGILAASAGIPVVRPEMNEAALQGAATLALVGSGEFKDFREARDNVLGAERVTEPDAALCEFYQDKLARYLARQNLALRLTVC